MRRRLPNRRSSETFSFLWLGMRFTATISRFGDTCSLAEVFLTNGRVNSQADTVARRNSAVVCRWPCSTALHWKRSGMPCCETPEASLPHRWASRSIWSRSGSEMTPQQEKAQPADCASLIRAGAGDDRSS